MLKLCDNAETGTTMRRKIKPQSEDLLLLAEPKESPWLTNTKPEMWLLEEYKLLSDHYFHEDNQIQKTIGIYGTLNGGLLAFLGSSFVANERIARTLIPVIGIVLCCSWLATLIRIREWRVYIEKRIQKIEGTLHRHWEKEEILPLDIRTVRDWSPSRPRWRWFNWPYLIFRNLPSSLTLLTLPIAFFAVWLFLLFVRVWGPHQ